MQCDKYLNGELKMNQQDKLKQENQLLKKILYEQNGFIFNIQEYKKSFPKEFSEINKGIKDANDELSISDIFKKLKQQEKNGKLD